MATKRTKKAVEVLSESVESAPTIRVSKKIQERAEQIEAEEELKREEAFAAVPFEWKGQELAPFSISRESDWMIIRSKFTDQSTDELYRTGMFFPDACRIVWLCLNDPKTYISKMRDINSLEVEIREWADANVATDEASDLVKLSIDILDRRYQTKAIPTGSDLGK